MTQSAMGFLTQEDEDRAAMEAFERSMSNEHRREVQRKVREGQLPVFVMPDKLDAQGQRTTTIRILEIFPRFKVFREHGKFQVFRKVCPIDLGFDSCEWCDKLIAKFKLRDRDQLLEDVAYWDNKMWEDVLDTDGKPTYDTKSRKKIRTQEFSTREFHAWPAWHYDGNEGKGEAVIFAYQVNKTTPITPIYHNLYMTRYVRAPEGQKLDINDFDILLTQHKDGWERTFDAIDTTRGPFLYKDRLAGLDLSKDAMMFGYALGIPTSDEKWLEQVQEKQKALVKQAKPVKVQAKAEEPKQPTVVDNLQLELAEAMASSTNE